MFLKEKWLAPLGFGICLDSESLEGVTVPDVLLKRSQLTYIRIEIR